MCSNYTVRKHTKKFFYSKICVKFLQSNLRTDIKILYWIFHFWLFNELFNLSKLFESLETTCLENPENYSKYLLSSTFYIRRKYWNHENFQLPIFNGFTRFRMSITRFYNFYQACGWLQFCGRTRAKTNRWNCMKFYA